jgi:hypothetical protein
MTERTDRPTERDRALRRSGQVRAGLVGGAVLTSLSVAGVLAVGALHDSATTTSTTSQTTTGSTSSTGTTSSTGSTSSTLATSGDSGSQSQATTAGS